MTKRSLSPLGDAIRSLRKQRGLSQAAAAKGCGISVRTLSSAENSIPISYTNLALIAQYFAIKLDEICGLDVVSVPGAPGNDKFVDFAKVTTGAMLFFSQEEDSLPVTFSAIKDRLINSHESLVSDVVERNRFRERIGSMNISDSGDWLEELRSLTKEVLCPFSRTAHDSHLLGEFLIYLDLMWDSYDFRDNDDVVRFTTVASRLGGWAWQAMMPYPACSALSAFMFAFVAAIIGKQIVPWSIPWWKTAIEAVTEVYQEYPHQLLVEGAPGVALPKVTKRILVNFAEGFHDCLMLNSDSSLEEPSDESRQQAAEAPLSYIGILKLQQTTSAQFRAAMDSFQTGSIADGDLKFAFSEVWADLSSTFGPIGLLNKIGEMRSFARASIRSVELLAEITKNKDKVGVQVALEMTTAPVCAALGVMCFLACYGDGDTVESLLSVAQSMIDRSNEQPLELALKARDALAKL